jgi:hypothetical protein
MTLFDFFHTAELPVPLVSAEQAEAIAAEHFGVQARALALGSQQDANFLLCDPAGTPIGVLKIANPAFSRIELEAQDAAAAFIAAGEGVRTATNIGPAGQPQILREGVDQLQVAYLYRGAWSPAWTATPTAELPQAVRVAFRVEGLGRFEQVLLTPGTLR